MSLGVRWVILIDTQVPLAAIYKAVTAEEFVLPLSGRPVLAPRMPLVKDDAVVVDQQLGMLECPTIQDDIQCLNASVRRP